MHVMKNGASRPGIRLFTSVDEPGFFQRWNPAASVEYSTFVNYADWRPDSEEDGHKDVLKFEAALIEAVRKENPECHILESSIKLDASTGIMAKVHGRTPSGQPSLPRSLLFPSSHSVLPCVRVGLDSERGHEGGLWEL